MYLKYSTEKPIPLEAQKTLLPLIVSDDSISPEENDSNFFTARKSYLERTKNCETAPFLHTEECASGATLLGARTTLTVPSWSHRRGLGGVCCLEVRVKLASVGNLLQNKVGITLHVLNLLCGGS